jgi:hypothetical protein
VVFDDITFGTGLFGVALAAWRRRKQQQPSSGRGKCRLSVDRIAS